MGLFDFVKSAGAKLFGGKAEPAEPQLTPAERSARVAQALAANVRATGIKVEGLAVSFARDIATVTGKVDSQANREKVVLAIGNSAGVARVDDRLEVEKPEPPATFYTVERGDTLSKIAKDHYGNAMKYPVIFEANKPMLTDPDKIYPGQVLRIPPQAA
jgi:nucleoid-associated protein YgaU